MRRGLVVGNWKMNGSLEFIENWISQYTAFLETQTETAICPPYVYISFLRTRLMTSAIHMGVGAQDCSVHNDGAYTGEVAANMLADVGCSFVIVGHSERRQYHSESNEMVAMKAQKVLEAGLRPIVCVGETLEEREAGRTNEVVLAQLNAVLDVIGPEMLVTGALAYEPVWAIGTGKTAIPEEAQEVHKILRDSVKSRNSDAGDSLRIIYGGSVKPSNAQKLFACPDIDGGLIGGASLKAEDFYAIAQAASSVEFIV